MILVGIDVAKEKHECFIRTLDGNVLHKPFSITNSIEGFKELYSKIIAAVLASNLDLTPYTNAAFQNEQLKSLTRYRFEKVRQRAKLK